MIMCQKSRQEIIVKISKAHKVISFKNKNILAEYLKNCIILYIKFQHTKSLKKYLYKIKTLVKNCFLSINSTLMSFLLNFAIAEVPVTASLPPALDQFLDQEV